MNDKERRKYLGDLISAGRFGKVILTEEEKASIGEIDTSLQAPKFDWDKLSAPPLGYYVNLGILQEMIRVTREPSLMNRPKQKYKLMEEIMAKVRFKPLASGTNRRTFYCEYDPSIVIKVGSDRVGRGDNIAEYYSQRKIKPFCCKVFDVDSTGTLALMERVETMRELEFKSIWRDQIFDIMISMIYRGYICEDVGGNFFKNWAIRNNFGPVMIDFPYVYDIDWGKLRCTHRDPLTHIECGGELDYDYSKGMSEIVCEKCGIRYSATYLGKLYDISVGNDLSNGRKFKMANSNGFKISIRRGNDVLYRSYTEEDESKQVVRANNTGFKSSVITRGNRQPQQQRPSNSESQSTNNNKELTLDDMTQVLDLVYHTYGLRMAINVAKKMGVFYKDPSVRGNNPGVTMRREPNKPVVNTPKPQPQQTQTEEIVTSSKPEPAPQDPNRPTRGLKIVLPKTAEELELEERAKRDTGDAVYGIPTEPLTQTLKVKQTIPKIKQLVLDRYDNQIELTNESASVIDKLADEIKSLIGRPIAELTNTEENGVDVAITITSDNLNRSCFAISVECFKSPMFEATIYPKNTSSQPTEAPVVTIDADIHPSKPAVQPLQSKSEEEVFLDERFLHHDDKLKSIDNPSSYTAAMIYALVNDLQQHNTSYSYEDACSVVQKYVTDHQDTAASEL